MSAIETTETGVTGRRHEQPVWLHKLRVAVAVAALWAALHYVADSTVLARGLDRPVTVFVGDGGVMAAVVVLVLLAAGALLGSLLGSRRAGGDGLLVVGWALALWACPGGNMDDWLKLENTAAGPATAAAYWPLLAEYAYWAVALAAVWVLSGWNPGAVAGGRPPTQRELLGGLGSGASSQRDGVMALVVTVVVAGTLMLILTGPRVGHTYRGQVYFAVAVAFVIAVLVARRVTAVRDIFWYLPGPLLVGVLGVFLAISKPGLPAGYENINVIPAWGLVRPLPVEMIGVGLVAILLTIRTATRLSSEEGRG